MVKGLAMLRFENGRKIFSQIFFCSLSNVGATHIRSS